MNFNRLYFKAVSILFFFELILSQTRIPDFRLHDRGQLWDTMNDDGTHGSHPLQLGDYNPSMDWPAGPHDLNHPWEQRSYLYKAGVWMGGIANGDLFLTKNGPDEVDLGNFMELEKFTNYIESLDFDINEAEEKIIAEWTTTTNINVVRTSRAWSFRELDDFIIITYEITNLNDYNIDDFYFGSVFLLRPSLQDFKSHNGWNDAISRLDDVIGIDQNEKLIYAYDGTGSFDFSSGVGNWDGNNLLTHGFAGFASLEAPVADNGEEQPSNYYITNYLLNANKLNLSNNSEEDLYNILSGTDQSLINTAGDTIDPFALISYGPYILLPDQSISISIVEAVDGLEYEDVIDLEPGQMEEYQNMYINQGLDSLINTIQKAKQIYQNNYIVENLPPPSPPKIELIPSPAEQTISVVWEPIEDLWINPFSGRMNIEKFIVYRSDRSFIGPWEVIKRRIRVHKELDINSYFDEDNNRWQYNDRSIDLGVSYYYAVTAVDSSGLESAFTNRNELPIQSNSLPSSDALDVIVFPNPFKIVSGIPTTGQENTIIWTNLPSPSDIHIYTASGELIKHIVHNSQTGDAFWDQRTDSRQITSPGIYYWILSSEAGSAKGTLVLIK
tara:strand:+ start:540 stop:2375 length:1836 start_codon:yes stop_codon:yes gene_type:complete